MTVVSSWELITLSPISRIKAGNFATLATLLPRTRWASVAMCAHSQRAAVRHGYRAMQYNPDVSANHVAVRLWKEIGFEIVGNLPGAFKHPELGYVDSYVMFKNLEAAGN